MNFTKNNQSKITNFRLKKNTLHFKKGDKVVYPNHGVGIIEDITKRSISGSEKTFYCLKILSTDSKVMVPVANTETVGLRKVLDRKSINQVLRLLRNKNIDFLEDWKGRYQVNSEMMRSGDIDKIAEVLKNLTFLSHKKVLSYRERKMLEKARFLLISEMAEVTRLPIEKINDQIDKAISVSIKSKLEH